MATDTDRQTTTSVLMRAAAVVLFCVWDQHYVTRSFWLCILLGVEKIIGPPGEERRRRRGNDDDDVMGCTQRVICTKNEGVACESCTHTSFFFSPYLIIIIIPQQTGWWWWPSNHALFTLQSDGQTDRQTWLWMMLSKRKGKKEEYPWDIFLLIFFMFKNEKEREMIIMKQSHSSFSPSKSVVFSLFFFKNPSPKRRRRRVFFFVRKKEERRRSRREKVESLNTHRKLISSWMMMMMIGGEAWKKPSEGALNGERERVDWLPQPESPSSQRLLYLTTHT